LINEVLGEAIEGDLLTAILINTAEINVGNREKLFSSNFDYFLEYYKKHKTFNLTNSITFSRGKTCQEEEQYINYILSKYDIQVLRLSIDFKGNNDDDLFFINNIEYGKKFLKTLQICHAKNIVVNGDCLIYPCMFEDEYVVRKKLPKLIENFNYTCLNNIIPFDVAPDLHYFHCYPVNSFGCESLLKFKNHEEAQRDFIFRKNILLQTRKIPQQCETCKYYIDKTCFSLCLGCSKIDSPIQKNK
jgi:hypothetical protein